MKGNTVLSRPRISRRIASAIRIVLLAAGAAQALVAALVIRSKTIEIRSQLVADGLRGLRIAAESGKLTDRGLADGFGDLPGHVVATYDHEGRLLGRSRRDVDVPAELAAEDLRSVREHPDSPIFLDVRSMTPWAVHGGVVATPGASPIGAVGVFDQWSTSRITEGLLEGLAGGWVASVVVAQIATLLLTRRIMRGLGQAEEVVHRMASGELRVRLPPYGDDEIGRLADDFNAMAARLEQTVESLRKEQEARRRRFADWTHEMATPLSSVLGYLESLQMPGFDDATRKRHVATALEQAQALKALSDDLTTLSQIELEGLALDLAGTETVGLVRAEVEALDRHAEAARVIVRVDAPDRPVQVLADRRRLAQVIRNLLTNALRHTPPDGHVVIRIVSERTSVVVEVEDDGEGIAQEHLEHLGEMLYRADRSRDRRTGGRGLGLAIGRGIVRAHHGELRIESELGRGTKVRVEMPAPTPPRSSQSA
jgi:two-component system, OmpR family, sensor histidine kinase BaeS